MALVGSELSCIANLGSDALGLAGTHSGTMSLRPRLYEQEKSLGYLRLLASRVRCGE